MPGSCKRELVAFEKEENMKFISNVLQPILFQIYVGDILVMHMTTSTKGSSTSTSTSTNTKYYISSY